MRVGSKPELSLGNVTLDNPFLLAPLAGVTDSAFRSICKEQGAALVYSEMVSAKGLYYNDKNTEYLLSLREEELPAAYQIFGSEPEMIAFAADRLKERKNCIIDINMGCPVPKVVKNGEGSALLKRPELAQELVRAAVRAAGKPVTVKMRIGWDDESVVAAEFAKAMEEAGAAAVAVHGRTREQFYTGTADWSQIRAVKEALSIPVIGNGDVFCGADALRMMEETGCDFVMIAWGAMGNPWIFREAIALWNGETPEPVNRQERWRTASEHFDRLLADKGEYAAVREMRKHVGWYTKGLPGSGKLRGRVNTITDARELRTVIASL
ncbi:MAG: tRNA dihydrouridine synthase DusB [Firmicutes bacterium]|nr:tRNA dihydrouridine synthase DusB [Bacillota bacterium]